VSSIGGLVREEVSVKVSPKERKRVSTRPAKLVRVLSLGLHQAYDPVLERSLPSMMGRPIGELVFRDLYPFSGAFGVERRMFRER
jgi:hypothetical protein